MFDFISDPVGNVLVKLLASDSAVDCVIYPVLRKLVTQVLPSLLDSGLITNLLFSADIVEREGSNVDHAVNLREYCYATMRNYNDL
jgi:hypothetical protein